MSPALQGTGATVVRAAVGRVSNANQRPVVGAFARTGRPVFDRTGKLFRVERFVGIRRDRRGLDWLWCAIDREPC